MQNAQQQIIASLVNNHGTFAATLEEYSDVMASSRQPSSVKSVSARMNQSAQTFKERGIRGQAMAAKLNKATGDLFARIEHCLR